MPVHYPSRVRDEGFFYDSDTGLHDEIESLSADKSKRVSYTPLPLGFTKKLVTGNNVVCCTCLEAGKLLSCTRCGSLFHLICHYPPIQTERLPNGKKWLCNRCKHEVRNGGATKLPKRFKSQEDHEEFNALTLRYFLDKYAAEGHPQTLSTLAKAMKVLNSSHFNLLPLDVDEAFYNLPFDDVVPKPVEEGDVVSPKRCYFCRKSKMDAEMMDCDYCDASFHLDCFDPPYTFALSKEKRWMCPLHVEYFLDSHILRSLSVTDRLDLWREHTRLYAPKHSFFGRQTAEDPPPMPMISVDAKNEQLVEGDPDFVVDEEIVVVDGGEVEEVEGEGEGEGEVPQRNFGEEEGEEREEGEHMEMEVDENGVMGMGEESEMMPISPFDPARARREERRRKVLSEQPAPTPPDSIGFDPKYFRPDRPVVASLYALPPHSSGFMLPFHKTMVTLGTTGTEDFDLSPFAEHCPQIWGVRVTIFLDKSLQRFEVVAEPKRGLTFTSFINAKMGRNGTPNNCVKEEQNDEMVAPSSSAPAENGGPPPLVNGIATEYSPSSNKNNEDDGVHLQNGPISPENKEKEEKEVKPKKPSSTFCFCENKNEQENNSPLIKRGGEPLKAEAYFIPSAGEYVVVPGERSQVLWPYAQLELGCVRFLFVTGF